VFPPECLICHGLAQDGVDYRHPVDEPGSADLILLDPNYLSVGGYQTSTMPEHHDRYGMRSVGWKECFSDMVLRISAQAKLLKPARDSALSRTTGAPKIVRRCHIGLSAAVLVSRCAHEEGAGR
jgi:hypothetical protein